MEWAILNRGHFVASVRKNQKEFVIQEDVKKQGGKQDAGYRQY